MTSVLSDDRRSLSAPERVALMQRARRFRDRFSSWTCVLTDEASLAALSSTGTPLTSLIGMEEGRDSVDATREVFEARDLNKHGTIRDAALNGEVSPRHAAAITKGLDNLPAELSREQKSRAEQAFIRRAPKNTPKQLTELAPEVLAEVAPELAAAVGDGDAVLEGDVGGLARSATSGGVTTVMDRCGSRALFPTWRRHRCSRWCRRTPNRIGAQSATV